MKTKAGASLFDGVKSEGCGLMSAKTYNLAFRDAVPYHLEKSLAHREIHDHF